MTVGLPPAPPADNQPPLDANAALEAAMFGGMDAIRAAKAHAIAHTPFDLQLARLEPNDFGNGQRLQKRFGNKLLFVGEVGWFFWDKTHWNHEKGEIMARQMADETHTQIFAEAKAIAHAGLWPGESAEDFEARVGRLMGWAVQSGQVNKRNAMLDSAAPYLARQVRELDSHLYLFNCANGTLDLSDHENISRRKHRPADLITQMSPVKFDDKAPAPKFKAFLERALPDDKVRHFVQQKAGIMLTGDISMQSLVLNYGTGANGKSTLAEVLRYVLGDYAKIIAFASLLRDDKRRGSEASPDLARLRGARAAFASEPEQSVSFSEGLIKSLTGGQPITARELNKGFFEYTPMFKLWLDFNNKPNVKGTDLGIWRRLKLVPWLVVIPPEERDPHLVDKLKAEASGVLNWMLDGWRSYKDSGLIVPDAVKAATEEYQEESDTIGQFVDAALERVPGCKESAGDIFSAYQRWCKANGSFELGQTLVGKRVSQSYQKMKSGVIYYMDCRLADAWAPRRGHDPGTPPPPQDGDPGYGGQI